MKLCILCFSFIRKNIFPILITVTMLTVAMFILTTFVGEYHYMSYTRDVLNESELQNGVYFMMPSDGDAEREGMTQRRDKHLCPAGPGSCLWAQIHVLRADSGR